jgi:hypothetical protein
MPLQFATVKFQVCTSGNAVDIVETTFCLDRHIFLLGGYHNGERLY